MPRLQRTDILPRGSRVGSYVVDELASHGGFAALYRAHPVGGGAAIALKLLHRRLSESAKNLVRFEREAAAIRSLHHPHIVELYEIGALPCGRPFLAMEWLSGRNLRDELDARGPFTLREAAAVLEEIGSALAAAHAGGIVHRDVKAQNVMAIPRGDWFRCKLVDFGIAKVETPPGGVSLTTQTLLGTPKTAAPEQILGDPVDARTDIYALGVLLFQLVTGRLPFDAPSAVELEEMHLFLSPPRPSEVAPVSLAIDPVVLRAMDKAPDQRYPTVEAFLDAVRAATSGARREPARSVRRRSIGLWVALELPSSAGGDADEDELLDAGEQLLLAAERRAVSAGLTIVVSTATSMLATGDADRAAAVRELAAGLADELPAGGPALRVAVHEAELELRRDGAREVPVAGELLAPSRWPEDAGVDVTRTATSRSARNP